MVIFCLKECLGCQQHGVVDRPCAAWNISEHCLVMRDDRAVFSSCWAGQGTCRLVYGGVLQRGQGEGSQQSGSILSGDTGSSEHLGSDREQRGRIVSGDDRSCVVERAVPGHRECSPAHRGCESLSGAHRSRVSSNRSREPGHDRDGDLWAGEGHQRVKGADRLAGAEDLQIGRSGGVQQDSSGRHPGGRCVNCGVWNGEPGDGCAGDRISPTADLHGEAGRRQRCGDGSTQAAGADDDDIRLLQALISG